MARTVYFITSNPHKFSEAQSILKGCGVKLVRKNLRLEERRAETCEEIAQDCAKRAYAKLQQPLFVEDSGLFIKSLNGFPGTYSAHVLSKIGIGGILRLLKGRKERSAKFVCAIAYADNFGLVQVRAECSGKITGRIAGKGGFGYDPIFAPSGSRKTFAEDGRLKAANSHRSAALKALYARLKKR